MKVKIIATFAFFVITILVGHYSNLKSEKKTSLASLSSLESIAACEVSPNHSDNTGYCSHLQGGSGGSCVTTGSGSEPRCSGNI